jgi:RNA polymerase sigma-70 factor, ECF subfamily
LKLEKEFIELINEHHGILHKICNIYFYKNPYKEDFYQEMLIRLWKSYPSFKKQSTFSTWLYKVALNTAIDILRKQQILPVHIELSKNEYNLCEYVPDLESENKAKLYWAINCLTNIEKAIIILYLEEYDYKEIAKIMGISKSNTGAKINRIKNQLYKILKDGQK